MRIAVGVSTFHTLGEPCEPPLLLALAAGLAAVCARAQEWEVGGAGALAPTRTHCYESHRFATAGFDNRFAVGGVVGQDL